MTLITTNIYKTNKLHDLQMSPWVLEVFNKRCLFSYWCTPDPSQRCGRDSPSRCDTPGSNFASSPTLDQSFFSLEKRYGTLRRDDRVSRNHPIKLWREERYGGYSHVTPNRTKRTILHSISSGHPGLKYPTILRNNYEPFPKNGTRCK